MEKVYTSINTFINYKKASFGFLLSFMDREEIVQELIIKTYEQMLTFDTSKEAFSIYLVINGHKGSLNQKLSTKKMRLKETRFY